MKIPPKGVSKGIPPLDLTQIHHPRTWKTLKGYGDTALTTAIHSIRQDQPCLAWGKGAARVAFLLVKIIGSLL